jgi:lipoprotein-anchoring transpeptidase ErfK/SrfK
MKYFCRLTGGGVGMHIGILPGYPASHGCVRLPAEIAPLIYKNVKVGTPVRIES